MNKEEILIAIKEIQCRYSLPALGRNFTDKDYACEQYEKLVIHLANQQEKKDKEIERLNNIINELEEWLGESIEKHTEDYLDWKYDRNVYLEGSKKLQNVLDKLQKLKGVDEE